MSAIPDRIGIEVGWRVWRLLDGDLHPVHIGGPAWMAEQPLEAACLANRNPPKAWVPVSIEEAIGAEDITHRDWFRKGRARTNIEQHPPKTRLPESLVYAWRLIPDLHSPPEKKCECGVYSVASAHACASQLQWGTVIGTVAMWGKIIPGDKGFRAQFAYPHRLWVVAGKRYEASSMLSMWTFSFATARANDPDLDTGAAEKAARKLADRYGVAVSVVDDWRKVEAVA